LLCFNVTRYVADPIQQTTYCYIVTPKNYLPPSLEKKSFSAHAQAHIKNKPKHRRVILKLRNNITIQYYK